MAEATCHSRVFPIWVAENDAIFCAKMGMPMEVAVSGSLYEGVPFDDVLKCVHCGLCLDACPTYRVTGLEQDSPRGRLYLMRGLWEGELDLTDEVRAPLSRCLDCRACETACPSLTPYGSLLEKTRGVVERRLPRSWRVRLLRWAAFRVLLPSRWKMRWFGKLSRHYQRSGLSSWMAVKGPQFLRKAHQLMPHFSGRSFIADGASRSQVVESSNTLGRVALFSGCIMDIAEREIHEATLKLITALGYETVIPNDQACCGALQVHSGERKAPRKQAKQNQQAFQHVSRIVVNVAGCGAQLKEYADLFSDTDESWQDDGFAEKIIDILALMEETPDWVSRLSWRDTSPIRVYYDAPCHLLHAQKKDFRHLLAQAPGVDVIPLTDADQCCGAAGIYNLLQTELSEAILDQRLDRFEHTPKADVFVTGNPGCIFQWRKGFAQRDIALEVLHPVVFLARRLA